MSQAVRFLAQNKYLLVDVVEENSEVNSQVVLPEGYKKQENPFKMGVILDAQEDSVFHKYIGSYVLFPSNVLEEISVAGLSAKMVPSNAVYGVIELVKVQEG